MQEKTIYLWDRCPGQCSSCENRKEDCSIYCPPSSGSPDQVYACECFKIKVCSKYAFEEDSEIFLKLQKNCNQSEIFPADEVVIDPDNPDDETPICFSFPEGIDPGWWQAQLCFLGPYDENKGKESYHIRTSVERFFVKPCVPMEAPEDCENTATDCVVSEDASI